MNLTDGLFSDNELSGIMGSEGQIRSMLLAEAALARVQGRLGVIPTAAAVAISQTAESLQPDMAALISSAARAGIPSQAVVGALKKACGEYGEWAHYGATSQDIQDTGLILQIREALTVIEARLIALDQAFAAKTDAVGGQIIPARTRFQLAAPTTVGGKLRVWRAPLSRHLQRLAEFRSRLLTVSLHGAAGTGAALAPRMAEIRHGLADELGLSAGGVPWHATRDNIAELGNWLTLVSGSLGKFGIDLIFLGQSEVAEISAGVGGGSSTMPQKSNPVAAEALVSIARLNAGAIGTLHQAMVHALERDGSAMALEWQILPDMLIRTGAALRLAVELTESLTPRPERINQSFANDRGAMLAETAGFFLAREMPRTKALEIVAQALAMLNDDPAMTLPAALAKVRPQHDWQHILRPEANTGDAGSSM